MRICTQISTGKIIEMQSNATAGTLIANGVASGFDAADLREDVVTEAEYKARMDIQEPPASKPVDRIAALESALIEKGVLTEADIDSAKK